MVLYNIRPDENLVWLLLNVRHNVSGNTWVAAFGVEQAYPRRVLHVGAALVL